MTYMLKVCEAAWGVAPKPADVIHYEVDGNDVDTEYDHPDEVPGQVGYAVVEYDDGRQVACPVFYQQALNRFMAVVPSAMVEDFNEAYGH
jgi:hypothetical protein